MAYYPIKDIGKIGVVTDLSPTDLPPNAFTDAINARFIGGQITKFGGNKPITYDGPENNVVAYAIQPMPFDFQYDHPFNILGTKDGLYLLEDQHWENISYWEPIKSGVKKAIVGVTSHPTMTGIKLTESQVNVKTNQKHDFYATLLPEGVQKKDLIWSLSNGVGTLVVDPNDSLHAVFTAGNSVGSAIVNVTNTDGSLNDFASINVISNVDALSIDRTAFTLKRGAAAQTATVNYNPSKPTNETAVWQSSDTTVFTITVVPNTNGDTITLTPGRIGSADLTVQLSSSPSIKAKARVTVVAGVDQVQLTPNVLNLTVGDTTEHEIQVNILPTTAPVRTWHYSKARDNFACTMRYDPVGHPNSLFVKAAAVGQDTIQFVSDEGGVVGMIQVTTSASTNPSPSFKAQDDYVEDIITDTVEISTFSAWIPSSPLAPKPVDGTLKFSQDLESLYSFSVPVNEGVVEVKAVGGKGPYTYEWYISGVPDATQTSSKIDYQGVTLKGNQPRQVKVTDADGKFIISKIGDVYLYDASVPRFITNVKLDKTSLDLDQGEKATITATVQTNDGIIDNLVYFWDIKKDGVVTHDELDEDKITIYGLSGGTTNIEFNVWPTTQVKYNVTPENNWYHTAIANCAVFNTNTFPPMVKDFGRKNFRILPGWGEQTLVDADGNWYVEKYDWRSERLRAFNNRLFALNMVEPDEGGVERHYPQRIRWSNFATENNAPTLWDDLADLRDPDDNNTSEGTLKALTNGYAGYIDLADTQGDLMEMLPLKDYLFVYTEFETYVGTPTMNAYQPMTFKKLFNDSGILAPNCVCEVEGGHFVITQNDIILHNGVTKQSVANSIVKQHIINEISSVNPAATRVYAHYDKKEIWICYVPPGMPKSTWFNSKAAVWNYEFQTWTFYELPHTYEIVLSDPPTLDKTATWENYNDPSDPANNYPVGGNPDKDVGKKPVMGLTWDSLAQANDKIPWQKNFLNFRKRITIGCSEMKGLYQMDIGSYNWTATDYSTMAPKERPLRMWVERYGIDFDQLTEEWRQKHINNFHFQVNGTGELAIECGGTQYSNEVGHRHNYRQYIAGQTRNLSVRLNHPYLYYAIVDEDVTSKLSINGLVIDFALGGRR